ncbi:histone H2B.1-like [Numida meleagris]|uniref:histone H2B.1-like n=1 Tax=Numida meleagris TaxID=8996 RepID=UPI000B3E1C1A|nr:histone H2B.1-like [Numida meleagris]
MVSAGGKKRRPQEGRRSRARGGPQKRTRQKTQSRRPPSKKVAFNGKTKQKPKDRQRRRGSSKAAFDPTKALKQDGRLLSREAKVLMAAFLRDVCRKVESEAERLRKESQRPVVGPAHVRAALHRVMPKNWKHAAGGR